MFAHVMLDSVEMVKTAQEVSSKRNKAMLMATFKRQTTNVLIIVTCK